MTEHLPHRTAAGERWDTLAHRYYGDVSRQGELIAANRDLFLGELRVPAILPAGLVLRIPIRERPASGSSPQLPAWKR